jgi:DNA-binding CsgD family transcriptional regulator
MKELSARNRDSQRVVGYIGSLTMLGFACSESSEPGELLLLVFDEAPALPSFAVYVAFAALFLATVFCVSLRATQVPIFFLLSAIQSSQEATRHFGLGFAVVAAMILLRRGWFLRKPAIKAAIVLAVGSLAILAPLLARGGRLRALPSGLFWTASFAIIVVGLARSRYLPALGPRKRLLRLADFNLTKRQRQVVMMRIAGKSAKEIALETDTAISTVRNILSTSYRKLGVEKGEGLLAMGERYTVE